MRENKMNVSVTSLQHEIPNGHFHLAEHNYTILPLSYI